MSNNPLPLPNPPLSGPPTPTPSASVPALPSIQPADMEKEQSFLQFVIGRYDSFFDSIHNKANFWLAFNTFSLGGIVAAYKDFIVPLCVNPYHRLLNGELVCFILLNLASSIFILAASLPYLKRKDSPVLNSAIFFVDVAARDRAAWHQDLNTRTAEENCADYREQARELAIGLTRKYWHLRWGGALLLAQVGMLVVLFSTYILTPPCPTVPAAVPSPPAALVHTATVVPAATSKAPSPANPASAKQPRP